MMSTRAVHQSNVAGLAFGLIALGVIGALLAASGRVAPSPSGSPVGSLPSGTTTLASNGPPATTSSTPGSSPAAAYRHVWWIFMENREYRQIIGSNDAPYINELARRYGLATSYYGIRHPSEPNYVA